MGRLETVMLPVESLRILYRVDRHQSHPQCNISPLLFYFHYTLFWFSTLCQGSRCQTCCTSGKAFKDFSDAADLWSGLQLKAGDLLFYPSCSRSTVSRERPRLDGKFHRDDLACSV